MLKSEIPAKMTHNRVASPDWSGSGFLLVCFLLFILSPKIDLIPFHDSGIRPEDLIFLVAVPLALKGVNIKILQFRPFIMAYLGYIFCCVVSSFFNIGSIGGIGFIYTARQFQYFLWFFVGYKLATRSDRSFYNGMQIVSLILIAWALGEFTGIIPRIGKFSSVEERISVNTSGPYEVSVLVACMLVFSSTTIIRLGLFLILLATQARITLFAYIVMYFNKRPGNAIVLGASAVLAYWVYGEVAGELLATTRVGQTGSYLDMATMLQDAWEQSWAITDIYEYFTNTYDQIGVFLASDGDISFQIRAIRWSFILRAWLGDWFHFLFGWGPGAWGLAVDGNYIRVVGETGVLGSICFLLFIHRALAWRTQSNVVRDCMILIAISSIFIDIAVSSKIMTLFWVLAGREVAKASDETSGGSRRI